MWLFPVLSPGGIWVLDTHSVLLLFLLNGGFKGVLNFAAIGKVGEVWVAQNKGCFPDDRWTERWVLVALLVGATLQHFSPWYKLISCCVSFLWALLWPEAPGRHYIFIQQLIKMLWELLLTPLSGYKRKNREVLMPASCSVHGAEYPWKQDFLQLSGLVEKVRWFCFILLFAHVNNMYYCKMCNVM